MNTVTNLIVVYFILVAPDNLFQCLLYPHESETRESKSLNGIWKFKISPNSSQEEKGFKEQWFKKDFTKIGDYIDMPVPSSYNDITSNKTIRDFIGVVWYQRDVFVSMSWKLKRVIIHFGSVHYNTTVWCNGKEVGRHEGGHMPFQIELTRRIKFGDKNFIVVAVNNTLTNDTVPQGFLTRSNNTHRYPPGYMLYSHNFDYFDYAGINRDVILYTTPLNFILDISVKTGYINDTGIVEYNVTSSRASQGDCYVSLEDKGKTVAKSTVCLGGNLVFDNVQLWWPAHSNRSTVGYLYTIVVLLKTAQDVDVYRLPVGIRTLEWTNSSVLLNNEPLYLRGFGMHEDSDLRGRGFDNVVLIRDINLILWTGANAVRTSHYPYSSEFLYQADKRGIMVILESPACSLSNFGSEIYTRHVSVMKEIISVYRNHPSIIMWSLANEPFSNTLESDYYFGNLSSLVRMLDPTRPVTFVTSQQIGNEKAIQHVDVVCVNRYSAWYQDQGQLDLIFYQTVNELSQWHEKYNKSVIITEYGAGSVSGFHNLPVAMWSEDYQAALLTEHFRAFDDLRTKKFFLGEMIWNFADFSTPQEYIRPGVCAKGLFTRARQPKSAAHAVRQRYTTLTVII